MSEKIMTMQQWLSNFFRSDLSQNYELTGIDVLVLHALASYCFYRSECNPSQQALNDYSRASKDAIQDSLQRLEKLGLVEIMRRNGARNIYKLLIPQISDEEIYQRKKRKPAAESGRFDDKKLDDEIAKAAAESGRLH